jgi:hypothetical protein
MWTARNSSSKLNRMDVSNQMSSRAAICLGGRSSNPEGGNTGKSPGQ